MLVRTDFLKCKYVSVISSFKTFWGSAYRREIQADFLFLFLWYFVLFCFKMWFQRPSKAYFQHRHHSDYLKMQVRSCRSFALDTLLSQSKPTSSQWLKDPAGSGSSYLSGIIYHYLFLALSAPDTLAPWGPGSTLAPFTLGPGYSIHVSHSSPR